MNLPPPPGEPRLPAPPGGDGPWPAGAGAGDAARRSPGPVAIRPLNLGELLDGAFKLFVANWRTILLVTAIFVVPLQLLSAYWQRDLLGAGLLEMFTDPTAAETMFEAGGTGEDLAALLSLVNALFLLPLVTGVVAVVVATSYLGGTAPAGAALAAGIRRWWALIASWVLLVLASILPLGVAVGAIVAALAGGLPVPLVVLVGLVLVLAAIAASLAIGSLLAATPPAIVVERLGAVAGLRRSARLLRPRLLPVIGVVVVASLLVAVLSMALGGIPQVAGLLIGDRYGWMLVAIGGVLAGLVTTPLLAIVVTLLYFDGRVRSEALDLRIAAEGLAAVVGPEGDAEGGPSGR